LSAAEIRRWHELTDIDVSAGAAVIARLDNGDPLLVEHRFGEGVVTQMSTSCDADWSDLPLRPFFVPLMQQLVTTMASGISPPRNIRTGEPAVAMFTSNVPSPPDSGEKVAEGRMQEQDASLTLSIVTPDGSRRTVHTVPQGKMQLARFEGTQRPGIYAMSTGSTETLHFVAETSRDESDLTVLSEPRLVALSQSMAATVIKSSAEYLAQDRLRRHGQEIWKYVLAAMLAFMFLELVLQQRFARVRA
jgi:hypothetical protein